MTATNEGSGSGRSLLSHHRQMLEEDSAIDPAVIAERGYFSVTEKKQLDALGFGRSLQYVPSLVVPVHGVVAGELPWYMHRPDETPVKGGKPRKYLIPQGMKMALDIHPRIRENLGNPGWPLFITEGARKADALITAGARAVVGLVGVWNWRGTNHHGGKTWLADWEWVDLKNGREVYVVYDSDVALKEEVRTAMDRLGAALNRAGARASFVYLPAGPGGTKTGVDDFIARDGAALTDVVALAGPLRPPAERIPRPPKKNVQAAAPIGINQAVATFKRWLHLTSPRPLYVAWGTAAANRLPGDPVWLLHVGASGAGKTEIVRSFDSLPEVIEVSTITETGLLSGTSTRERADDATGGLLRQIGAMGTVVVRDFTSVLSMDRDHLARILAALREIYDGRWQRHLGADGGRVLEWEGKVGLLGGVTGYIDRHFSVMSQMGERLLLHRLRPGELTPIVKQALMTVGQEEQMRSELAAATAGVFAAARENYTPRDLTDSERDVLINVGILVARGRAGVFRYGSRIEATVDPEVPTRLARQLLVLARGMDSLGIPWSDAWSATLAVALGCIPDIRARVLFALYRAGDQPAATTDLAQRLHRPSDTVRYALQDLNAHGLTTLTDQGKGKAHLWELDPVAIETLDALPDGIVRRRSDVDVTDRQGGGDSLRTPEGEEGQEGAEEIPTPPQTNDIDDTNGPVDDYVARYQQGQAEGLWGANPNAPHPVPSNTPEEGTS
jgi:hypothetical protein